MSDEYGSDRWGGHSLGRFTNSGPEDGQARESNVSFRSVFDPLYHPKVVRLHAHGDALGVSMPNGYVYGAQLLKDKHLGDFNNWLTAAFDRSKDDPLLYPYEPGKSGLPPVISEDEVQQWFARIDDDHGREGLHCQL